MDELALAETHLAALHMHLAAVQFGWVVAADTVDRLVAEVPPIYTSAFDLEDTSNCGDDRCLGRNYKVDTA